jgi:uncharacterized membrane protein
MKALGEFVKTTLIGGLLIVVPIYFAVLLLLKAVTGLMALLHPIVAALPSSLENWRRVAAAVIVVAICFVLGLITRTRGGRRAQEWFETTVLEKIPGFAVVRGIVRRISGTARDETFQPVLVEIEDALTPAFIVEELEDDRFVVLVPSVPTPAAGAIYILPRERIHWIDASVTEVVGVITKWGSGTGRLVKAMR